MNKTIKNIIIALSFLIAVIPFNVYSGEIDLEIKGIHLGMKEKDVLSKLSNKHITIGGVEGTTRQQYDADGGLAFFAFSFTLDGFQNVYKAVNSKYPLRCEKDVVKNAMNATFERTTCLWESSVASLILDNNRNSINDASLLFASKKFVKQQQDYIKNDI